MKKYTHIYFDLDHTLWDTDRNAEESLRELYTELNLESRGIPDFDTFHQQYKGHNEKLWGLYAENKVGKSAVRLHRFLHALQDFGVNDAATAQTLADEFIARTPRKQHLIEGARETLQSLQGKFKLNIITNGFPEAQYTKLKESGLMDFFDHVFISEEVGVHKPDPKIFHHAMKVSGAQDAASCVMVGDTFQTDIFGALNAGMKPVHYTPDQTVHHGEPVITVHQLTDLLQHL
ncbi:MAG: YjjG family noncanonical pyrimidine nucleotidase [Bacteroidia bacterium]